MKTEIIKDLKIAENLLKTGEVIALPAEACFGLSALPEPLCIRKILSLKGRSQSKGLILVGSQLEQLIPWIDMLKLKDEHFKKLTAFYERATTWLVPAKPTVSRLLRGQSELIAIRLTNHPVLAYFAEVFNMPLISTSANLQGEVPARSVSEVLAYFDGKIKAVFDGNLGKAEKPSQIIELLSGHIVRN